MMKLSHSEQGVHAAEGFEALEPRQHMDAGSIYNAPFPISTSGSAAEAFSMPLGATEIASVAPSSVGLMESLRLIRLNEARADVRYTNLRGNGVSVAVLDTGINLTHPFFGPDADGNGVADRIVYQYDFGNNDADASDRHGHGSNVASIIGSQNSTFGGVAPGVNFVILKVFTDAGAGNFAMVERALQWVVNNAWAYNIVAVNMSLGDSGNWNAPQSRYGLGDELAALAGMNVTAVASAGNSFASFHSEQGLAYPASDPNVLAVGAVYDRASTGFAYGSGAQAHSIVADQIAPFSQRTTSMSMIFAPGAPITGAGASGVSLTTMHGTSQASPHVAGVVALAQQLSLQTLGRRLSVAEVRDAMLGSGRAIVDGDDENDNVANTGGTYRRVVALGTLNRFMRFNPIAQPEVAVTQGTADIQLGATSSVLGTRVGTPVVRTFVVHNTGRTSLSLSSLAIGGSSSFSLARGLRDAVVAPGARTNFQIAFAPSAAGAHSGWASFATNDPDERSFRFNFSMPAAA